MLYSEVIERAKEVAIIIDDASLKAYLRPDYRHLLHLENLTAEHVSDFRGVTNDIIAENLKLEVEAHNLKVDRTPIVMDWLATVITSTIEPAMIDQENELFKNMMEYMQLNDSLKDKERELEHKEQQLEQKSNIRELIPGMNFSKAKP